MGHAARQGHLEIVRWLYERRSEGHTTTAMESASCAAHFHVVRWLHEHCGEPLVEDTPCAAVSEGGVGTVQWVLANIKTLELSPHPAEIAVGSGDFEVTMALHSDGRSAFTKSCLTSAYWEDRFEILQWLMRNYPRNIPAFLTSPRAMSNAYWRDCLDELNAIS